MNIPAARMTMGRAHYNNFHQTPAIVTELDNCQIISPLIVQVVFPFLRNFLRKCTFLDILYELVSHWTQLMHSKVFK